MSKQIAAAAVVAVALAGCGGGGGGTIIGGGGGGGSGSLNGVGGIWEGTIGSGDFSGYDVFGIVGNDGSAKFWLFNGSEGDSGIDFALSTITPSGTSFTTSYIGYANGVTLPNGTAKETGSIQGNVDTATGTITGSFQSTDSGVLQDTGNYTLYYDTSYASGSDPATLAGNYTFTMRKAGGGSVDGTGMQFTINGLFDSIVAVDADGCHYTGSATPISSLYNAYAIALTLGAGCTTSVTLTGVGALVSGEIRMIVDDGATTGFEIIATPVV